MSYAVKKDGTSWRAVDGPDQNKDVVTWTSPDYNHETFSVDEPLPPTRLPNEILAESRLERDRLLQYATLRINPLQYAADVDEASDEDLALLRLWKKYSVAISKTETKPGWPESPQWPDPPVPLETLS